MTSLSEMLDRKAEEIKQPPLLPPGIYLMQGTKHPDLEEVRDTSFERVTFQMKVIAPSEVDAAALEEYGNVVGAPARKQFLYDTDPDKKAERETRLNQIKGFLTAAGVFPEGSTLREAFANYPGSQFLAEVTHRPDKNDPERFYLEVGRTFSA